MHYKAGEERDAREIERIEPRQSKKKEKKKKEMKFKSERKRYQYTLRNTKKNECRI
jgi:hypothetical protein